MNKALPCPDSRPWSDRAGLFRIDQILVLEMIFSPPSPPSDDEIVISLLVVWWAGKEFFRHASPQDY